METLRKPTREEMADFIAWRTVALSRMPYMAAILFSVRVLAAPGLKTMAVDRHHRIYIDFDHVNEWGPTGCGEVLLHEACHLLGEHAELSDDLGIARHDHRVW